jgi:hypothetical protein
MPDETIETIRTLLESALDDVDDDDVSYRLRTALQLLDFQQNQIDRLTMAAEQDEDLQERLDALGYLD